MRATVPVLLALLLGVLGPSWGASAQDSGPDSTQAQAPERQSGSSGVVAPVKGSAAGGDPYWPLDGNGGTDAQHYRIKVGYDFASGRLRGTTTIRMRALTDLRSFSLDLLLPVTSVNVEGRKARFRTPKRHEVRVVPKRPLAAGQLFTVRVSYAGTPSRFRYAGERNWLADSREVVTMNQPHMAPWWFPSNDHPTDKATFDVRVRVPKGKQVVSNGDRVSRKVRGTHATTRWRSTEPMATYLAYFAAGDFAVEKGTSAAGIPFYNAVSRQLAPAERDHALRMLRRTAGMTDWLQARLGDYPFSSTGGLVTGIDVSFALENQTRPTYGAWIYPGVMVHELAHQWFGDSVAVERWRDIWLNEGFATYMEVDYDAAHGGPSVAAWLDDRWDSACQSPGSAFWRLDISDPGPGRVFDGAVYDRGAMTVAALGVRIGSDDLTTVLRTWVAQHRDGNATVEEFEALAESISGEELDGFFDAWLRSGAAPAGTAENGLTACP